MTSIHSLHTLVHNGPVLARQQKALDAVVAGLSGPAQRGKIDQTDGAFVIAIDGPTRKNDPKYDGCLVGAGGLYAALTPLDVVAPVLPDNGAPVKETVILINGIMTDVAIQQHDMQALANTGCAVRGVHNATAGMGNDLLECVLNKLNRGDTPAVDTLARLIAQGLLDDKPVRLIGHSQGALITARALQVVDAALRNTGMNDGAVKAKLASISVETYGGASSSYVDGPRYLHTINNADAVPMLSGIGLDALNPFGSIGENAAVRRFTRINAPGVGGNCGTDLADRAARFVDQTVHGPRDVYFKFRAAHGGI